MANAVGKVALLEGQAFARGADGSQRALKVGDVVMEGEVIVTAPGGHVELALDGGQTFLVREKEAITLDNAVLGIDLPEGHEAALLDRIAETAAITRAIAEGSSLDDLLEETAAGLDGGGSEDGHGFVQLLRIVEGSSILTSGFEAGSGTVAPEALGMGDFPDAVPQLTVPPAPANRAPVANADTLSATEDTAVTYTAADLLGNDTDADGNPLSIASVTSGTGGTAVLNGDGTVTFTPNANYNGVADFSYTVTDGSLTSNVATVTVNVAAVADAPVLAPLSDISAVSVGSTRISTAATDALASDSMANYNTVYVAQSALERELGVAGGYLDNRFDPTGANVNDPGFVNAVDGKITESHYSMSSGMTVHWDYTFSNGEDLSSEVSQGYNDVVVLMVTDPTGSRQAILVDSSESKFPAASFSGTFEFTATMVGDYTFQWLVINSLDAYKDSQLALSAPSFAVAGDSTRYGAAIDLPLSAALSDVDGSESLSVTVSGLPAGARLTTGTHNADGSWTLTAAELADVEILTAQGYTGTFSLAITATATEVSNGSAASTTQHVDVTVAGTTATYLTSTVAADDATGTAGNDLMRGYSGNDTIHGGAGSDIIYGGADNDTLYGDTGNDALYGGTGNDVLLSGGDGNDLLVGGAGNDTLNGGAGADVFKWLLNDAGTVASPATDTITDGAAYASTAGEALDLRDLLQGEVHAGTSAGTLTDYLHFTYNAGTNTTTVEVKSHGAAQAGPDQFIVVSGANLVGTYTTDAQIIQNLLNNGKLITD